MFCVICHEIFAGNFSNFVIFLHPNKMYFLLMAFRNRASLAPSGVRKPSGPQRSTVANDAWHARDGFRKNITSLPDVVVEQVQFNESDVDSSEAMLLTHNTVCYRQVALQLRGGGGVECAIHHKRETACPQFKPSFQISKFKVLNHKL